MAQAASRPIALAPALLSQRHKAAAPAGGCAPARGGGASRSNRRKARGSGAPSGTRQDVAASASGRSWRLKPQPAGSSSQQQGCPKDPGFDETLSPMVLVQVLHDFYNERLEPLDHHVMRELEARTGSRTCLQELSKLAGITPGVRMKESSYNQFWLYLDGLEPNFVDQRSPMDPYPADLWWALQNLASSEDLGRSRFECAKLIRRRLPYHLGSRCLGEICHIVELAVRKHKVLGYREGLLVAFTRSLEYEKREQAGVQRRSHHAPDREPLPVANWESLRTGMQELFVASGGSIALSSLKTLFRERLQTLLSETALEHTKLSAVFQDPRLTDVCRLMARGPEKFVVSVAAAERGPEAWDIAQLKSARRSKTRSGAQRRQQTTASGSRSESGASSEEDGEDAEEAGEGEAEGFAEEEEWGGEVASAASAAWPSDAVRWLGEAEA